MVVCRCTQLRKRQVVAACAADKVQGENQWFATTPIGPGVSSTVPEIVDRRAAYWSLPITCTWVALNFAQLAYQGNGV